MNRAIVVAAIGLGVVLTAATAVRAQGAEEGGAAEVTVITSERLTFDYIKQYALFEKDVVVVDPKMKIFADKMTVLFDDQNKARNIKAEGNVVIIQLDKRAKSNMAEYKVDTGEIVLSGNPMVTSGRNILTADLITFWRDDNRMECKPNSRLVIYPDDQSRNTLFGDPARGR